MGQLSRRDFLKGSLAALPLFALHLSPQGKTVQRLATGHASPERPNILVLVFDTLSAGHMSLDGYGRSTTPNFDRFANGATVYHRHYAGGNFTSPGTASLLTGTYPWTHRALHLQSTVLQELAPHNLFSEIDDNYYKVAYTHNLLVAALLSQFQSSIDDYKQTRQLCLHDGQYSDRLFPNDWNTAFLGEWQNLRGSKTPGSLTVSLINRIERFLTGQRIDSTYANLFPRGVPNLHSLHFILEDVIDWLLADLARLPQPFLAYVHVLPPHEPYNTRRDFVNAFAGDSLRITQKPSHFSDEGYSQAALNEQRVLYDEFLAYTDAEFGRLWDELHDSAMFDNTTMVITSDHGEMFERGIRGHVTPALYEPICRIPLMIRRPGQTSRIDIHEPTSCIDLLPTLLAAAGQVVPEYCEGQPLPVTSNAGGNGDQAVFVVEAKSNPKLAPLNKATIAMIKGNYKLIHNRGYGENVTEYELYDLEADPEELEDLYATKIDVASSMVDELRQTLVSKDAIVG